MKDLPLTLAHSPCPNDTYIFAAWANGLLARRHPVRTYIEDIENLNNSALRAAYELTKISYGAIPLVTGHYRILRAGGALGRGCGPLLVARPGTGDSIADFKDRIVAIPGEMTTAFVLLRLAMSMRPQTIGLRFDKIVDAVKSGAVDAGLIIHESRFTYDAHGLVCVQDLGDWWEGETGMPIPLGAILVRSDVRDPAEINETIRESLRYACANDREVMTYVREHAREMDESVMRRHIETYVNEFSEDVGEEGISAVAEFFRRAKRARIVPETAQARFV
jgi:1,4-dihydroxy-6-naphthoate synthase